MDLMQAELQAWAKKEFTQYKEKVQEKIRSPTKQDGSVSYKQKI